MLSDSTILNTEVACHICGAKELTLLSNYPTLPRVASDCVPWPAGGKLAICNNCSCVQNPVDDDWNIETSKIYSKYKLYQQSAGNEQGVSTEGKKLTPRSVKVFQYAEPYLDIKKKGCLLDIGCANGELLRCFSKLAPHWEMVGFEIDDKCREEVEQIPGVVEFVSGTLDQLNKSFDIITLIHVLEHLPNPKQWLENLHRILNPNGFVIIQLPDPKQNPFNLLVADHCSHFLISDLIKIAEEAQFKVIAGSEKWIHREFTLIISPKIREEKSTLISPSKFRKYYEKLPPYPEKSLKWLQDIIKMAKSFPKDKPKGIWGTAIAATWLDSIVEEVNFFVDEDISRIGQFHLGRPIYHPKNIPQNSNVFIAIIPEIADEIKKRWQHLPVSFYIPPMLVY